MDLLTKINNLNKEIVNDNIILDNKYKDLIKNMDYLDIENIKNNVIEINKYKNIQINRKKQLMLYNIDYDKYKEKYVPTFNLMIDDFKKNILINLLHVECLICNDIMNIPCKFKLFNCHRSNMNGEIICGRNVVVCYQCVEKFFNYDKPPNKRDTIYKCPICRDTYYVGSHIKSLLYTVDHTLVDIIDGYIEEKIIEFNKEYGTDFNDVFRCYLCEKKYTSLRKLWYHLVGYNDDYCKYIKTNCVTCYKNDYVYKYNRIVKNMYSCNNCLNRSKHNYDNKISKMCNGDYVYCIDEK